MQDGETTVDQYAHEPCSSLERYFCSRELEQPMAAMRQLSLVVQGGTEAGDDRDASFLEVAGEAVLAGAGRFSGRQASRRLPFALPKAKPSISVALPLVTVIGIHQPVAIAPEMPRARRPPATQFAAEALILSALDGAPDILPALLITTGYAHTRHWSAAIRPLCSPALSPAPSHAG